MTVRRLGSKPHEGNISLRLKDRAGTDWSECPVDLRIREFPEKNEAVARTEQASYLS